MIFNAVTIWVVDVGGSFLMIVLSVICVYYAMRLKGRDSQNIVWTVPQGGDGPNYPNM